MDGLRAAQVEAAQSALTGAGEAMEEEGDQWADAGGAVDSSTADDHDSRFSSSSTSSSSSPFSTSSCRASAVGGVDSSEEAEGDAALGRGWMGEVEEEEEEEEEEKEEDGRTDEEVKEETP